MATPRPGPSRAYPDNNLVTSYTVPPLATVLGEWVDLGSPSIVTVIYNVQGLAAPETLDCLLFGLIGYQDAAPPPIPPDYGATDGAIPLLLRHQQTVTLSASEYEYKNVVVVTRWCYVSLVDSAGNTNTASVTVSIVT